MTEELLVQNAKTWLRITNCFFDDEIKQVINACLIDLENAGVKKCDLILDDSLVQQAIKLYLKSFFGENEKAEIYLKMYDHLKNALAIRSEAGDEDA